jgi:hypothetical protein
MERAKEQVTAPPMFDGDEDKSRKDYGRRGKAPKGKSGHMYRKYKRSRRR